MDKVMVRDWMTPDPLTVHPQQTIPQAHNLMKTQNPVAKHLRQFNKAVKHTDRKKALKRGYQKHKSRPGGICHLWGLGKADFQTNSVIDAYLLMTPLQAHMHGRRQI